MTAAKKKGAAKAKPRGRSKPTAKGPLTWTAVVDMARRFPLVTVADSYGTPGIKVRGLFLSRLKDPETIVLKTGSMQERDYLIQNAPKVFYITDHYKDYPAILVRLATAKHDVIAGLIEDGWRRNAGKRAIAAYDAE